MILAVAVYMGFGIVFLGVVALLHPLQAIGLTERSQAIALMAAGLCVIIVALLLPAGETRIEVARTRLDDFIPRYQFSEFHSIHVHAAPATAYRSVQEVTANEIHFFQLLTWIRRFGRAGPESILNAPEHMPLLEVATRTTFLSLAQDPPRELVIGTLVGAPRSREGRPHTPAQFAALELPGYAKAAMNFRVEADGAGGSIVSTETRVYATDAPARRRFAAYWRLIVPGSALIRRRWLAAVRKRAEKAE